ncbi:hypothetical protein pdul_cds_1033 [Pandoravirus dulcis]|uniref:Uncharacterized protein n=1 Tax=Pandoravirus dulcis TaxID=1349409 RepID=S4VV50_9VIRU|nr:hypothetical protein pdul_cds_1033 [Pandoravirus dulcis]AGO83305.1 hypothetical protein pdul_cds_1033 [Pandoravirus dulcis]
MATVRSTTLCPAAAAMVLDNSAEQLTGMPARTKRKRDSISGVDGKDETTTQGGGRSKRTQPRRWHAAAGDAEGCPWTDAAEAPVVWTLVVEFMLAEVASLDRSGFGDGAQKRCWRMARALALLGSVCRALYDCVGGLGVRFDMLVAADSKDTGSPTCPISIRLLWCVLRRNSTPSSWDVIDTDGNLYHRMCRLVWCEMRSGHLCAPRASGALPPGTSTPAEADNDGCTTPKQRRTEDSDRNGTEDERHGDADDADNDDDSDTEIDSDDDDENPTGPYRSRVELPHYRDTWDDIKWENEDQDEIIDDDEEDYEDSHQDEEGTLCESGTPYGEWTLTIFNHCHNGLILTGAKVEP